MLAGGMRVLFRALGQNVAWVAWAFPCASIPVEPVFASCGPATTSQPKPATDNISPAFTRMMRLLAQYQYWSPQQLEPHRLRLSSFHFSRRSQPRHTDASPGIDNPRVLDTSYFIIMKQPQCVRRPS